MRITITLSKENEKYIKSIKGYGESLSSTINNALKFSKLIDEQNKKYDILLQKIDNKNNDEQFNFIEDFKNSFKENGFVEIEKIKNLRKKIKDFEEKSLE